MGRKTKVRLTTIVASLTVAAPMLIWPTAARANVGLGTSPEFTSPTVPGQVAPARFTFTNNSTTAPEAAGPVTITDLTLIPSCGTFEFGCPFPDLNVFQLNGPFVGTGSPGATCPTAYTASVIDPGAGTVRFTPVGPQPVLNLNESCFIDFTTTTLRVPSRDAFVATPGVQTATLGVVTGTAFNGVTDRGSGLRSATVNLAPATLVTQASSSSVDLGSAISDTATLSGGLNPTGTITFNLYGPDNATCTGTPVFTSAVPITGDTSTFPSGSFTPTQVGTYRWIASYSGDVNTNSAGPTTCADPAESVVVTFTPTPLTRPLVGDFDGDGLTDIAVWRPSTGTWYVRGFSETLWGQSGDIPVPADYAGDLRTEIAVFRPANGTWYIRGVSETVWGRPGDIPVPADYNGDGKAEIAVFRPSNGTWYVKGISETHFGLPGDIPVAADYTGDAKAEIAVFRPSNGTWYVQGVSETVWGQSGDIPVAANYGGDAHADLAVYRPANGTWYVMGISETHFGLPADLPVPGDYDGGGTDIAVWRPSNGTWFIRGISQTVWGQPGDTPV